MVIDKFSFTWGACGHLALHSSQAHFAQFPGPQEQYWPVTVAYTVIVSVIDTVHVYVTHTDPVSVLVTLTVSVPVTLTVYVGVTVNEVDTVSSLCTV